MAFSDVFAMDTSFFSSLGSYGFGARCEMLAELGYDATYLTLWDEPAGAGVRQLGAVGAVGFSGPVGLQGYPVAGDAYAKLRRSLAAFREIERRLDTHPDWAALRPPR